MGVLDEANKLKNKQQNTGETEEVAWLDGKSFHETDFREYMSHLPPEIANQFENIFVDFEESDSHDSILRDPLADVTKWKDQIVYIASQKVFRVIDMGLDVNNNGANIMLTKYIEPGKSGRRQRATDYIEQTGCLDTVVGAIYHPLAGRRFEIAGQQFVNEFRASTVPLAKDKAAFTEADREAVSTVKQHIQLISENRTEVYEHLILWMAHNVQHLGLKIKHAPLIVGCQGDGKTMIADMLGSVIGSKNIYSTELKSMDFNSWATDAALCVFEEIYLTGADREKRYNALKACITNEVVEVQKKGIDCRNVPNTTNQLAFSNKVNAMPLEPTDRRWMIILTPWGNNVEKLKNIIRDHTGLGDEEYFTKVGNAIKNHIPAIRRWLLDVDLKGFNRHGRAPDTPEKKLMRQAGMYGVESAISAILTSDQLGITENVVSTVHLRRAVEEYEGDRVSGQKIVSQLLSLNQGWTRWYEKFKFNEEVTAIYGRGKELSSDKIREVLTVGSRKESPKKETDLTELTQDWDGD